MGGICLSKVFLEEDDSCKYKTQELLQFQCQISIRISLQCKIISNFILGYYLVVNLGNILSWDW